MVTWSRRTCGLLAAGLLALGLAACQPPDEGRSPAPGDGELTTLTPEPSDEPTEEPTTEAPPPSDDPRVESAVADLAERLDVDPAEIEVGELEEVTWSDGSIGCPEQGQMYTQALVPGTRLILTVDGTEYAYHGAGEAALAYCANPVDPAPSEDATA